MRRVLHGILLAAATTAWPAAAQSLYDPAHFQALTSDVRPRRPGDLITVMVIETASATSSANTSLGRDANVDLGAQALAGRSYSAGLKSSNQTDGRGTTQREGRVLAQITVTIRSITERGDMVIAGEQVLDINNERQRIALEGRVRPEDVSDTNVVQSTRVADARISYSGIGDLSDKQRPAWWQRFLTTFGL